MTPFVPTIDVDVHEPRAIFQRLVELGAQVTSAPLPSGDYRSATTLVERKTVQDFHLTLVTGRLWSQIGRLRASARKAFLLVEGGKIDAGPVSPAAIRGALLAVSEQRVVIVRSESPHDSALWVLRIAARGARPEPSPDRPPFAQRPKPAAPQAAAEAALASVRGISVVSARSLLEHFGTLDAVVRAKPDALAVVRGIGPVRAAQLRDVLTHSHSDYRSRRRRERPGLAT